MNTNGDFHGDLHGTSNGDVDRDVDGQADHRWANLLLTRAIGAEPELGFQAHQVLIRAYRERSRRRALLAGALTLVVLVAVGLLIERGLPHNGAQTAHNGGLTTSTTAPATATTIYGVEGPLVLDAKGRAMTAELAAANPIPTGATLGPGNGFGGQPLVFYRLISGQNKGGYFAQATVIDAHGAGHLIIEVYPEPMGWNCQAATYQTDCHTQTLPDGSHLTALRYTPPPTPDGAKESIQWVVEVVRPDGTAVDAMSGNWSEDATNGGVNTATGAEPPVSEAKLLELVQLPGLRL